MIVQQNQADSTPVVCKVYDKIEKKIINIYYCYH